MTLDRTLKEHGGLAGRRSVLTRAERIERMIEEGEFDPKNDSPLGIPKTKVKVAKAPAKKKKAEEEETEATEEAAE